MPLLVSQLLWRAGRAGTHIGTLCNLIYNQLGEPGVRRVFGILSLAKKFGTAAVEDARAVALEMGSFSATCGFQFPRPSARSSSESVESSGEPKSVVSFLSTTTLHKNPGTELFNAAR
jgi:hypothetical protein